MNPGDIVIVGAAETDELGKLPHLSELEMHAQSARNALTECGLTLDDVDGITSAPHSPVNVAHYLGVTPRWMDGTQIGGCSFVAHVRHAAAAISAGLCETVLVLHGESGRSGVGRPPRTFEATSPRGQFELPYGVSGAPSTFTLPILRYMAEYGLTPEMLAMVPVTQRQWAAQNPRAYKRDPLTVDDVLASPYVAYPIHLDECCLVTDGGGALVVTSRRRAEDLDLRHGPIYVLGTGEACESPVVANMVDATTSGAFRRSGADAFQQAGLTTKDIDHLMIYDAFAHLPIYGLEDLGFVGKGEGGPFIADGNTLPGGPLPLNTNGGGLSYTHTGMYGMFAMQESVRQLRGVAPAQVDRVEVSMVQAVGGIFMAAASLILSNRLP